MFTRIVSSIVKIAKPIFLATLGRWGPLYRYTKRFYALFKAIDPHIRFRIVLTQIISNITSLIFLGGTLVVVPFVNYVIRPESVHDNEYLNAFYEFSAAYIPVHFGIVLGLSSILVLMLIRTLHSLGGYLLSRINLEVGLYYVSKLYHRYMNEAAHGEDASTSEIVHNINGRLPMVLASFINPVFTLIQTLIYIGAGLGFLLWVDPYMFLLSIGAGAIFLVIAIGSTKTRARRYSEQRDEGVRQSHQKLLNAVGAREYIQMLGKQNLFTKSFVAARRRVAMADLRMHVINLVIDPFGEILFYATMVLLAFYIILTSGADGISDATIFLLVFYRIMPSMRGLFGIYLQLKQGVVAYDKFSSKLIRSLLDPISYAPHTPNPLDFKKAISLKNVSYAYPRQPEGELALAGVNLRIPAGSRVGVCGVSGCGKTTLMRLLTGRVAPSNGEFKVDKQVIKDKRIVRRWQDNIGYVTQNLILIEGSLANNIALIADEEEINDEALQRAIDLAELRGLVNQLSQKEHTPISEFGGNISGGQRQRIVIARALYNEPKVLILDEATSSLDKKTESKIFHNIENVWKSTEHTAIFVTHRLDSIKDCDLILMLSEGKVVRQGTYKELIKFKDFREIAVSRGRRRKK